MKYFLISLIILAALFLELNLWDIWQADKNYNLGKNLDLAGEYVPAFSFLSAAVNFNSGEPTFHEELAFNQAVLAAAFFAKDSTESANLLAKQAVANSDLTINTSPKALPFWKGRIRVFYTLSLLDKKYLNQALAAVQKAVELAPTDAKMHYNLGLILAKTGQKEAAKKAFIETLQLKPDYSDAKLALEGVAFKND